MDHLTSIKRSENMRRIKSQRTLPEIRVRKALRRLKIKYRSQLSNLPGRPDFLIVSTKLLLFVNGCFWHKCPLKECGRSNIPNSNRDYWIPKLKKNVLRDKENMRILKRLGWTPKVIWECETKRAEKIESKINRFLRSVKK